MAACGVASEVSIVGGSLSVLVVGRVYDRWTHQEIIMTETGS